MRYALGTMLEAIEDVRDGQDEVSWAVPLDGVWLPLAEAAVALGCSTDTVRRRLKQGSMPFKLESGRYLVFLPNTQPIRPLIVEDEVSPNVKAILELLREDRELQRQENSQLHEELAKTRAELVKAQAALPPKRRLSLFEWLSHLWAAQ